MKQKYYIRGLGFGILITTLVFSFTDSLRISDEEIIRRAEEMGYYKLITVVTPAGTTGINLDELMSKLTLTPAPTKSETGTPAPTQTLTFTPAPSNTPEPTVAPTTSPTETLTPMPTTSPVATLVPQETLTPTATVIRRQINVVAGSSASQVCRLIEDAGIVEDWEDLRKYLGDRGLVDYINIGSFTLSSDMTYEEIAYILTGR